MAELHSRLKSGAFERLDGVGTALSTSLLEARFDPSTKEAVWEVEDYCDPPLARECNGILDRYFTKFQFERVHPSMGWLAIEDFPLLWTEITNREKEDFRGKQINNAELAVPGRDETLRWYNQELKLDIYRN